MARRSNKADRLKKAMDKIKHTNMGGGGVDYWTPKEGRNVIRIFAGVGEMESFFQPVGRHEIKMGNSTHRFTCPDFTIGDECPICEFCKTLFNSGDKDSKDFASSLWYRKAYWMNVLVRGEEEKGPQLWTPGIKAFRQVNALLGDPDLSYEDEDGAKYSLILDEDEGLDLIVYREGTGRDTTYQVRPATRENSMVGDTKGMSDDEIEEKIDKWFDACFDLTPGMLSDDPNEDSDLRKDDDGNLIVVTVLPYDRLKDEFEALDVDTPDEEPEEEEDNEEDERVERIVRSRRSRRSRR